MTKFTLRLSFPSLLLALACGGLSEPVDAAAPDGMVKLSAFDEKSHESIPIRFELRDARGRAVRVRPDDAVVAGESMYFDGQVTLGLRRGQYTFLAEAGPEFITRPGNFTIDRHAEDTIEIPLERKVDMREEGWWAGDLDVQLPLRDVPLIMRARAVDFAPVTTVVNDHGRCRKPKPTLRDVAETTAIASSSLFYGSWATLDHRRGGGLLAVGADALPDVCRFKADDPSLPSAEASRDAGAAIVALTPSAWDLPVWVAAGKLDAVAIINRHSQLDAVVDNEADGRPRDKTLFPDKIGRGRYSEAIYHHLLNCGLRIPPAAGSGAGAAMAGRVVVSPLGTNRVYVYCNETCTRESWLEGMRAGRLFVTNGPLLRTRVEGEPPGHVFQIDAGETRGFQITLDLAFYTATQVEYLEIIKDGKTLHHVRLDDFGKKRGRLPPVEFDSSGWFLVRAVTNNSEVYQFASTGPYYVESNYQPRISHASVQFFLAWVDDAAKKFAGNAAVLAEIKAARPFWQKLLERATVD
jgi:hypothetical protein